MSHRRRYAVTTSRETVVDLLALDTMNPRSVLYHLSEVRDHVGFLPNAEVNGQMSPLAARHAAGPHRPSRSRRPTPSTAPPCAG